MFETRIPITYISSFFKYGDGTSYELNTSTATAYDTNNSLLISGFQKRLA
jgi:hypothetical protein